MARSNLNLLLLLSGNGTKILQAHGLSPSETDVIKIDEKVFASPRAVWHLIRTKPYRALYFGCDRLWAHRFAFVQKLFIAITTRRGGIVDEIGAKSSYTALQFLLVEMPLFLLELLVSLLVVVWFHGQIFFDRRAFCKVRR
ncbi:MAG: hypothetical protein SNJ55_02340 [Chloroherpetonaceae bacterium]